MSLKKAYSVAQLHNTARRKLPSPVYDYVAGGADDEINIQRNMSAFEQYQIVPRCLRDVSTIETKTHVLGCAIDVPFFISPVGQQRMLHPLADIAGAKAAARKNTLFTLSTFSSKTIEEVAKHSNGSKMFQVYVLSDNQLNREIFSRAKENGYQAMCLTVDTVVGGNRERDIKNGLTIPMNLNLKSMLAFATQPRWVWNYFFTGGKDLVNLKEAPSSKDSTSFLRYMGNLLEKNLTWELAKELIDEWQGPFAIKGILSPQDAAQAKKIGASAIIVSNHGGRQLDSTPAPIEMLAEIRAEVGDDMEIILDGGISIFFCF